MLLNIKVVSLVMVAIAMPYGTYGQSANGERFAEDHGNEMPNHWGSVLCQPTCNNYCQCEGGVPVTKASEAKDSAQAPSSTLMEGTASAKDCYDLLQSGIKEDNIYNVYVGQQNLEYPVYCDMQTRGGGWLVFQRRVDGAVNFTRNYQDYEVGFGDLMGNFWLGNTALHLLTGQKQYTLLVQMADFDSTRRYAEYSTFLVGSATEKYNLTVAGYSGTAGDSLAYHSGQKFSTWDSDNDRSSGNCALTHKGGWWFNNCDVANANAKYHSTPQVNEAGIEWKQFRGSVLKSIEMKIRPN